MNEQTDQRRDMREKKKETHQDMPHIDRLRTLSLSRPVFVLVAALVPTLGLGLAIIGGALAFALALGGRILFFLAAAGHC